MPSPSLRLSSLKKFGKQHPALAYGLALLLGCYSAFSWTPILILPIALVGLITSTFVRCMMTYALLGLTIYYCRTSIQLPQAQTTKGIAYFEPNSVSLKSSHMGKNWIYSGKMLHFEGADKIKPALGNFMCQIQIPCTGENNRPKANQAYKIEGTLIAQGVGSYFLKTNKQTSWHPLRNSWSLGEVRLKAKKTIARNIQRRIKHQESAAFLAGIATGSFDDRLMSFEFSRFGLQHIMAISGFHFAIIASILNGFLRLIWTKRVATLVLILILSSYFLFLGPGPSIFRAWFTAVIGLSAAFLQREASPLNSLGLALMVILFLDPLMYRNLGFQFSFLSTAAILVFFPIFDELLKDVLKKRGLSDLFDANGLNRHGYVVLTFLRQALALTFAVNLIALPLLLYYFQKFPLLSFVYNLFFPFLVSASMLLLIVGSLLGVIPFVGAFVDKVNTVLTKFTLDFTYNMPKTMDYNIYFEGINGNVVVVYLCVMFLMGIWVRESLAEEELS